MGCLWIWGALPGIRRADGGDGGGPYIVQPDAGCGPTDHSIGDDECHPAELYFPDRGAGDIFLYTAGHAVPAGSLYDANGEFFLFPEKSIAASHPWPARKNSALAENRGYVFHRCIIYA